MVILKTNSVVRLIVLTIICCVASSLSVASSRNLFKGTKGAAARKEQLYRKKQGRTQPQQAAESSASSEGLESYTIVSVSDPMYEWSQYETKSKSSRLTPMDYLLLESKSQEEEAITTTELEIDPESDFKINLFLSAKPENDKYVGFVFDYESNRQYKAVIINKKSYEYVIVEDGVSSVVKQGLAKTGKDISTITFDKHGDKATILINGLETTVLKKIQLSSTTFGTIIKGKYKIKISGLAYMEDIQSGAEESTTPE